MHGTQYRRSPQMDLPPASVESDRLDQALRRASRTLAEETPVALVYNGTTLAVLMATPEDLADLAIGFSLTEGIVRRRSEIQDLEICRHAEGIELRMWLAAEQSRALSQRRRRLVGPTGCGLCGIESLTEANRRVPPLQHEVSLAPSEIAEAVRQLTEAQALNRATRATHAAGFYLPNNGRLILAREDVGRHNALDKLAGALAARDLPGHNGALVLTSRISIELVQKAAAIGAGLLIAVSAPTALAVRTANACGMTLVGVARGAEFEIFSHPGRIS